MKKLLTLFTALLFVGSMWADEAEFAPSDFSGQGTTSTGSPISATKSGVTFACDKGYGTTQIRCYSGGKITISSSNEITAISFTFSDSKTGGLETSYTGLSTNSWEESLSSQARITECTVTYTPAGGGCETKVNISAATPTNGTFTLSNSGQIATCDGEVEIIVTPTPEEHYEVDEVTASNGGNVSGPDGEGNYTVTYAQDYNNSSEIAVSFVEIEKFTITWDNNGVTSTSQVYKGEKPVFPATPKSCDETSTTFIGWATEPWDGKIANLNEKTVYTSANDMPTVSAAKTYYAVFAKATGSASWTLTPITDLTASDIFVIADEGNYALNNNNGASSAPSANAITVAEGKITSTVTDNLKWNISGNSTNGYTFYPNGSTTTWLYCNTTAASKSNDNMRVGTGDRKVFEVNGDGYLVTKDTYTSRYLSRYNTQDFRGYTSTNTNPVKPKCYKYIPASCTEYMTTCCEKYAITIANSIENGSVSADFDEACEGTVVTLTPSANPAYHFDAWDVYKTGESSTKITVTSNQFTMPAYAVTVSATFEHDACTQLATPANVIDIVDITSAMLGWDAVEHADKYTVYIYDNSDIEIEHGDVNTNEYTVDATLNANTTYKYTIQAVSNTPAIYCESDLLNGTFTTDNYPAATLTLSENGETHDFDDGEEHVMKDEVTLPSSVTRGVDGKVFVGWDANASCTSAPTYAKGAKYTLEDESQTLYAVYATKTGEDNSISITSSTENFPDGYGDANTFTEYTLEGKKFKIQQAYVNSGKLQWRAAGNKNGTGTMYNSEALAGLTSVVLTYDVSDSGKNFTVIAGSSANPDGDAITPSIDGNTYTFDCSGNSYFVMTNGEYAGYLNAITINTSASYSGYVTTGSYTPTALDNTEVEGKAVKVLRNGVLLIEKNGHTYNAQGLLIK